MAGGRTDSVDFPITAAVAQRVIDGVIDGFAARGGDMHVVGRTLSADFPTMKPLQPTLTDADYDVLLCDCVDYGSTGTTRRRRECHGFNRNVHDPGGSY